MWRHLRLANVAPPVAHALEVIGTVHGVPDDAPVVTVAMEELVSGSGRYGVAPPGRPFIVVDPRVSAQGLIVTHEFGHFLNDQVFDEPGSDAAQFSGEFEEWRSAILSSAAVRHLQAEEDRVRQALLLSSAESSDMRRLLRQLAIVIYGLRPRELLARSYAQFIAQASRDATLLADVSSSLARSRASRLQLAEQWEPHDFAPIFTAIEHLFRERGLL